MDKEQNGLEISIRGGCLSPRQRQVMERLASGSTTRGIAREMRCSIGKVINEIRNTYTSVGVHSKAAALVVLVAAGEIDAHEISKSIHRYTPQDY